MKKIVTIIIVIAVIVGAFFFFRSGDKKVTTYETVELKKGSINNTVTATGTIEPITKVDVGTQVSGTISHIYVDYNSVVTKGQLLAELDRKTTGSRVEIGNGKLEIKQKRIRVSR